MSTLKILNTFCVNFIENESLFVNQYTGFFLPSTPLPPCVSQKEQICEISITGLLNCRTLIWLYTTSVFADFFLGEMGRDGCLAGDIAWSTQMLKWTSCKKAKNYFLLCFTKSSHLLATPSLEQIVGGRLLLVSGHCLKEKVLLCLD